MNWEKTWERLLVGMTAVAGTALVTIIILAAGTLVLGQKDVGSQPMAQVAAGLPVLLGVLGLCYGVGYCLTRRWDW